MMRSFQWLKSTINRHYHRSSWENEFKWSSRWEGVKRRPLSHYIIFAATCSTASYGIAMVVDAEREKKRRAHWLSKSKSILNFGQQNAVLASPHNQIMQYWSQMRESQRTMSVIVGMNALVFLAWRVPSLQSSMSKWFLHSTTSHPVTMLTSVFSHRTPMHLGFNMIALWSFGTLLHDRLGREHFLAFYTTTGLTASIGSHLYKLWRKDTARSLGASGAVFGVSGGCAHMPDVNVSLIFLPFHSFPLEKALPVIMAFDVFGLIRGWSTFDHAAHLAGAASGYLLYSMSTRHLWRRRTQILRAAGYPLK